MHAAGVLYTVATWAVQPEHGPVEQDAAITPHEVSCASGGLPNWEAGDHENLKAEMIKSGNKPLTTAIMALLNAVWATEHVPLMWKLGTIVSLHKPGATIDPANYRGITLVSVPQGAEHHPARSPGRQRAAAESQAAFRPGRSVDDQVYTFTCMCRACTRFAAIRAATRPEQSVRLSVA